MFNCHQISVKDYCVDGRVTINIKMKMKMKTKMKMRMEVKANNDKLNLVHGLCKF